MKKQFSMFICIYMLCICICVYNYEVLETIQ